MHFLSCIQRLLLATIIGGFGFIHATDVEQQLNGFNLPNGGTVNLFAAEPLVVNPVQMNWDSQGRLWVVCSSLEENSNRGQIVVLEDTTKDGKADTSTLFAENLDAPTSVLPENKGVYVTTSTDLLFLIDTDNDGLADQQEVILSGWDKSYPRDRVHSLRYGPLGNIWFLQGSAKNKPGVGYFHPGTKAEQIFSYGPSIPWGLTFTEFGQSYLTDLEGTHGIYYLFPDADYTFTPERAPKPKPAIIAGISRNKPFYSGLEILNEQQLPASIQGSLATCDYMNQQVHLYQLDDDIKSTKQSVLVSNTDKNFQPVDIKAGPDGAIYIADWNSPTAISTSGKPSNQIGRIWRITFADQSSTEIINFKELSDADLIQILSPAGYEGTTAMRELQQRDPDAAITTIKEAWPQSDELKKLHLLMAAQSIDRFQEDWAIELIENANAPKVRAGALRCYYFSGKDPSKIVLVNAISDPDPEVRLWAVSALGKQDYPDTAQIALNALNDLEEKPNQYLNFALHKICKDHSEKWLPKTETGNPFANLEQLNFALVAVDQEPRKAPVDTQATDVDKSISKRELREIGTNPAKPIKERTEAITKLIRINPAEGAELAAVILPTLENANQSRPVFNLFLDQHKSSVNLANALQLIDLPQAIAQAGINRANASEFEPIELLTVLKAKLDSTTPALDQDATDSRSSEYVRKWQSLVPSKQLATMLANKGVEALFEIDSKNLPWESLSAKSNGDLVTSKEGEYQFYQIKLTATETTEMRFNLENHGDHVQVFVNQTEIIIPESVDNSMDFNLGVLLEPGEHLLTITIKQVADSQPVRLQAIDKGSVKIGD